MTGPIPYLKRCERRKTTCAKVNQSRDLSFYRHPADRKSELKTAEEERVSSKLWKRHLTYTDNCCQGC